MKRRSLAFGLGAAGLAVLGGCMVGPNFPRPAPPAVSRYTPEPLPAATAAAATPGGDAQRFVQGQDMAGDWWTLFHSPALSHLVAEALKANPDVAAAKAGLRAAHESYLAQWGALLPTADADYNVTRQKASSILAPPLSSNNDLFTLHTLEVTVTYAPDVFGGVRRQTEATHAQFDLAKWQAEAAYLTLTSNLVTAALQAASLSDQIAATKKIIAAANEVLAIVRRQRQLGEASGADVAAQEAILAQGEETLPVLERQLALQRDLIANLTGHAPSDGLPDQVDLSTLTLPADVPVTVPAKLVEQRPDVLASEANLHAASAEVGVAIANRLPSFQLQAIAGGESTNISTLFTSGNSFWSLAAGVTQPIFEGGALLHRQRSAQASLIQAKEQYRSAVLGALQNVADCLQALDADGRGLAAAFAAERSAGRSLAIARRQLELGQVSGIVVLNAEQVYQQAVLALVQSRTSRYQDTVALYVALGGGWWKRDDLTRGG